MAVRRLRIRRNYCLGLDGNLLLPRESLRVAFANTHGDCNRNGYCYRNRKRKCDADCNCNGDGYCYRGAEVYADAQAASDTSASAVRVCFSSRFFGDSRSTRESP